MESDGMGAFGFYLLLVSLHGVAGTEVAFEKSADLLRISIGGRSFAHYVWNDPNIPRPYFKHLHAPNGSQVTRNQPPIPGQDAVDHPHFHPGLWLAFGDISGVDYWRNKNAVRHNGFAEEPTIDSSGGQFAVRNRYLAGDRILCEETCRIRIKPSPGAYLIDWTSEFIGKADFSFGDQEEMGLGIRVATPIAVKQGGRIVNSNGLVNEKQAWGRQADWCDYSGKIDGKPVGVALMAGSANFRPCWFHARDYGVLVANPFGQNAFAKQPKNPLQVRAGEKFRLRFGVVVHAGNTNLQDAYRDWIKNATNQRG